MNKRPRPTFAELTEKIRAQTILELEHQCDALLEAERGLIRAEYEHAYALLSKHTTALELENAELHRRLSGLSVRRILWQRIKRLFSGKNHV